MQKEIVSDLLALRSFSTNPIVFMHAQSFQISSLLFYVYRYVAYVCVCSTCVPGACRSQKRMLDPLKLEITVVH